MKFKTKKQTKEMGYCNVSVLLNKYSRVPKTSGVVVKGETFFKSEQEEIVKSRTAWKREGRKVKDGAMPAGRKHMHRGKSIKYDVFRENDTVEMDMGNQQQSALNLI